MKINTLGIVLSYYRKKENLPLGKICDGLCSAATLERIERGERIADSLLGKLLSERIGKEISQFELMLDEEDYMLWRMRKRIQKLIDKGDFTNADILLDDYCKEAKDDSKLHEQFYFYQKTVVTAAKKEKNHKKICQLALQALLVTKEKFGKEDNDPKPLYTQTEIQLILILIRHGYMKCEKEMENELAKLLHYVEYFYTGRRKEEAGIAIIMELIELAQKCRDDAKLLIYIDKGIMLLSQGRGVQGLEKLHFLKAQTLLHQYGVNFLPVERKQEIQKECLMAYYICEIVGFTEKMQEIEKFCKEKMAWQITELEISLD